MHFKWHLHDASRPSSIAHSIDAYGIEDEDGLSAVVEGYWPDTGEHFRFEVDSELDTESQLKAISTLFEARGFVWPGIRGTPEWNWDRLPT